MVHTPELHPPTPSLSASALAYAEQGWPVLPVKARAKLPLTAHGVHDASADVRRVEAWWQRWPDANIGLAVPLGFAVLDLDSDDAWQRLAAEDRILPATVRARTARGAHLWYRVPAATRNHVALLPGIDLRTRGGYVLAPPSVHPSGAVYAWDVPLQRDAIADAPQWLLDLLRSPAPAAGAPRDWRTTIVDGVPAGQRNHTLAQVSGLLFRRLPAATAAELAYCWARVKLSPPLPDAEVLRTIDSIAGRELRRRTSAPATTPPPREEARR